MLLDLDRQRTAGVQRVAARPWRGTWRTPRCSCRTFAQGEARSATSTHELMLLGRNQNGLHAHGRLPVRSQARSVLPAQFPVVSGESSLAGLFAAIWNGAARRHCAAMPKNVVDVANAGRRTARTTAVRPTTRALGAQPWRHPHHRVRPHAGDVPRRAQPDHRRHRAADDRARLSAISSCCRGW